MSNVGLSCLHWGWGVINVSCKVVLLEEICQISQKPVRRSKWPCETSVVPIWGKCKQVIFLAKVHRFPLNLWQAGSHKVTVLRRGQLYKDTVSQIKCVSDCVFKKWLSGKGRCQVSQELLIHLGNQRETKNKTKTPELSKESGPNVFMETTSGF